MEWSDVLGLLVGILAVIGLPMALRKRKKGRQDKAEELYEHFQGIGVRASMPEKGTPQEKAGEKSVGVLKLSGKNIDSINVISIASQYGARYFLDFLVRSPSLTERQNKKTRMVRKRSSAFWGKTTDIEWRGDYSLAMKLNFDYRLKDKLLQADLNALKGSILVSPEPKYGHVRIRTNYFLPAPDLFEAIDIIAKRIKPGW